MRVTATLDTSAVTIADIDINGMDMYITYTDSTSALKVMKKSIAPYPYTSGAPEPISVATAATVIS
mgnify:CR=1 FL=1